MKIEREFVKTAVYKAGYEIREELWMYALGEDPTLMRSAYTPDGDYLGDPAFARRLIKRGITTFDTQPDSESRVVCIGYNPESKMWYGWSHRAICGFGIGDKIFDVAFGDSKTHYRQHGEIEIKTLEDAKKSALAFASHVS